MLLTVKGRARAELAGLAGRVLRPSERPHLDVWADRHRVIAEGTSERAGPWRTDAAPYLRGIMRAIGDRAIRTVTVIKASQLGVTECLFNTLGYAADCDPGPMMFVYPSGKLAGDLAAERIHPSIMACPRLVARLRARTEDGRAGARNLKAQKVTFDRMVVWLVGSNSQSELEARAVRYLLLDEIDSEEYGLRALDLARERTKAYTAHKIVQVSKPSLAGRGIDDQYARSDQRRYELPCPHPACGAFFEPAFAHLRWEGPGNTPAERAARRMEARPADVERHAWLKCPHCGQRIESHHKSDMLARGLWLRKGEWAAPDRTIHGEAAGGAGGGPSDHAGFRLSSLHSPWLPWGYVARRYVEGGGPTREWVNGDMGQPWSPIGDKADIEDLRAVARASAGRTGPAGGYRMCAHDGREGRTVPEDVCVLVGGIDLQRDRAYVEIRGFSERGLGSCLLYCDVVECPIEDPLAMHRLDELVSPLGSPLLRPRLVHADGLPIPVSAWAVDSGEGRRTREVYAWAMRHPHVYATKGASSGETGYAAMAGPFELKLLPVESRGLVEPGAMLRSGDRARVDRDTQHVRFLLINTGYYKDFVLSRIKQAIEAAKVSTRGAGDDQPDHSNTTPAAVAAMPAAPGAALGAALGAAAMRWPIDTADEYFRQLTAEHLVRVLIKSGINAGRHKLAWQMRPGRSDNHFLDTCVMTHALADAIKVRGVTRERFLASRKFIASAKVGGVAQGGVAGGASGGPAAPQAAPSSEGRERGAAAERAGGVSAGGASAGGAGPRVITRAIGGSSGLAAGEWSV